MKYLCLKFRRGVSEKLHAHATEPEGGDNHKEEVS